MKFLFFLLIGQVSATYWFKDYMEIRKKLINGEIVRVRNAFPHEIMSQFDDIEEVEYEHQSRNNDLGIEWFTRDINYDYADPFEDWLMEHKNIFELLVPEMHITHVNLTTTRYKKYDYLDFHNDHNPNRALTFILHMTDGEKRCAGQLVWAGDKGIREIYPKYNTLYMFIPSKTTWHMIQQANCGERYAISGWFYKSQQLQLGY